jgi:hypothetical protein
MVRIVMVDNGSHLHNRLHLRAVNPPWVTGLYYLEEKNHEQIH